MDSYFTRQPAGATAIIALAVAAGRVSPTAADTDWRSIGEAIMRSIRGL